MRHVVGMLVIALIVTACGGSAVSATDAPRAENPTPLPIPVATPPVEREWPAEFEEKVCIAVAQHSIYVEDVLALQDATEAGDLEAISLHAYSASADAETIDLALSMAPSWKPAATVVSAWREAMQESVKALDTIEAGASAGKVSQVEKGLKALGKASKLLTSAQGQLETFLAETGFECT